MNTPSNPLVTGTYVKFNLSLFTDRFDYWMSIIHPFLNFFSLVKRKPPFDVRIPYTILERGDQPELTVIKDVTQQVVMTKIENEVLVFFKVIFFRKVNWFNFSPESSFDWVKDLGFPLKMTTTPEQWALMPFSCKETPVVLGLTFAGKQTTPLEVPFTTNLDSFEFATEYFNQKTSSKPATGGVLVVN